MIKFLVFALAVILLIKSGSVLWSVLVFLTGIITVLTAVSIIGVLLFESIEGMGTSKA